MKSQFPLTNILLRKTALCFAALAFALQAASAAVTSQLVDFFDSSGAQVVSANGEPDDAALFRIYDTTHDGIIWQFMTQHLAPNTRYEIWLEGTNDGTPSGAVSWWLASIKTTPRGDLNGFGLVYTGRPPGASDGDFTNSLAEANLVVKTTAGVIVQTAFFPAL